MFSFLICRVPKWSADRSSGAMVYYPAVLLYLLSLLKCFLFLVNQFTMHRNQYTENIPSQNACYGGTSATC